MNQATYNTLISQLNQQLQTKQIDQAEYDRKYQQIWKQIKEDAQKKQIKKTK